MKLTLVLLLAACAVACNEAASVEQAGWVRSLWCNHGVCSVVIELEDHKTETLEIAGQPPLWAGEHVKFWLTPRNRSELLDYDRVTAVERLP